MLNINSNTCGMIRGSSTPTMVVEWFCKRTQPGCSGHAQHQQQHLRDDKRQQHTNNGERVALQEDSTWL
jgi:hypothetical protein